MIKTFIHEYLKKKKKTLKYWKSGPLCADEKAYDSFDRVHGCTHFIYRNYD